MFWCFIIVSKKAVRPKKRKKDADARMFQHRRLKSGLSAATAKEKRVNVTDAIRKSKKQVHNPVSMHFTSAVRKYG
jgi:hypothetical protein